MALDDYKSSDDNNPMKEEPPEDCDSWIEAEPGYKVIVGENDNSIKSKTSDEDGEEMLLIFESGHGDSVCGSTLHLDLYKMR